MLDSEGSLTNRALKRAPSKKLLASQGCSTKASWDGVDPASTTRGPSLDAGTAEPSDTHGAPSSKH